MRRICCFFTLIVAVIIFLAAPGKAEEQKAGSKFEISFAERFRLETWDNAVSLEEGEADARANSRAKSTLTLQAFPNRSLELNLSLTNENRYTFAPKSTAYNIHEVMVDNLFLKWDKIGGKPFTLTVGRQNMMLGEGFLIADGGPLDGSRTFYFNAVRLDFACKPKRVLTLFLVHQTEFDEWPVINDRDQKMVEQPETGLGLYFNGAYRRLSLEPYFIYKRIGTTSAAPVDSDIFTLGSRFTLTLSKPLKARIEGAYQFGSRGERDRTAFGGYAYLDWKPGKPEKWPLEFSGGVIVLSGDDPATDAVESWDPLFSRWPKWSESYIYTFSRESRVAYWSNFVSLNGGLACNLKPNLRAAVTYHRLFAVERTPASFFLSGEGYIRGDLVTSRFSYEVNKHFSGHFVWEFFSPGNFYLPTADSYSWLRFEFLFRT